jgi:multiple sugar transport system ATP-binding protein
MSEIVLDRVCKAFPDGTDAVIDLSLSISDGEFMVLVGPSGCGKTTALRMVAGLERVSAGTISIDGQVVNDLAPKVRDMAMVFQSYALYPHMSVRDNLGFSLRLRKVPRGERNRHVEEVAGILGIEELLDRKPSALSGGQRQRVAMGRAIVREPRAFLMDEPLSNLDAKLRVELRAELATLHRRLRTTTIYVTHDQVEAMTLGQRVAVLNHGRLQQVDSAQRLFQRPTNLFVAGFIGSPQMNFASAELLRDESPAVAFGPHRLRLAHDVLSLRPELVRYLGRPVIIGLRPSDFEDAALTQRSELPEMSVRATVVEVLGAEANVIFAMPPLDTALVAHRGLWTARVSQQSRAATGDEMRLSVDVGAMHFFDPESGQTIV